MVRIYSGSLARVKANHVMITYYFFNFFSVMVSFVTPPEWVVRVQVTTDYIWCVDLGEDVIQYLVIQFQAGVIEVYQV